MTGEIRCYLSVRCAEGWACILTQSSRPLLGGILSKAGSEKKTQVADSGGDFKKPGDREREGRTRNTGCGTDGAGYTVGTRSSG